MQCPKCHSTVSENEKVCPKCHKVLLLECPNCGALGESAICEDCGYSILVKCSKCSKINPTINNKCSSCGFPIQTSVAYQECESDEFVSAVIEFENLKKIRKELKSKNLYEKFYNKLKNILMVHIKKTEGKFVIYNDVFVLNFNKELSFTTSAEKSIRFALKVVNAYNELNINIQKNFSLPLGLNIKLIKKQSEDLLKKPDIKNNVKPLNLNKNKLKYLNGLQITIDQHVRDVINKSYKTDSLYSVEEAGMMCTYYEIVLDSYILEPESIHQDDDISVIKKEIKKIKKNKKELPNFKIFDINAKCQFLTSHAASLVEALKTLDLQNKAKILALKSSDDLKADSNEVINFYKKAGYRPIYITCNEQLNYHPWGLFEAIFKIYFNLPYNTLLNNNAIQGNIPSVFAPLLDFCARKEMISSTPEDARYAYMELWGKFLHFLKDTVIIIDEFKYIDDTSLQTLEIFFDNHKKINPNFVFITDQRHSLHSKIKKALKFNTYTEIELQDSPIDACMNIFKYDAKDFINSFYYEKLENVYAGSYLYFKNAIDYLKESGVIIEFENKILLKDTKSVILPNSLSDLCKARLNNLSKKCNISYIFAYSSLLSSNLDRNVLNKLNIDNLDEIISLLDKSGIIYIDNNLITIINYAMIAKAFGGALKPDIAKSFIQIIDKTIRNILCDATLATLKSKEGLLKEEYDLLSKNAEFAISVGDFDAYLKCYLRILSLLEKIGNNVEKDDVDKRKNDIYNNILMSLYSYAPTKIYPIEKILLTDAINNKDDAVIKKLSNLMLQGALISSVYTEAPALLHNILTRMENPVMIANGEVNIKFLLLTFVRIEVLYNVGQYKECVELAHDILKILNKDMLDIIKPSSFSTESFKEHVLENLRLAALSKLFTLDDDLEGFLDLVKTNLGDDIPDREIILILKSFFADKNYSVNNVETYSAYSKIILLIIQEFSSEINDYKTFAQHIYQAKLLAEEINQRDLKLFCEILIAYAYAKAGVCEKAECIYKDIINIGLSSSMFHIHLLGQYFLAKMEYENNNIEEALYIVNDALSLIRKFENQAQFFFVIFEKLYMQLAEIMALSSYDRDYEFQKISSHQERLKIFFEDKSQ